MDIETVTIDEIERQLLDDEAVIAQRRASQMVLLREVDRRQAPTAAGCRSLREWVAGRLDVAPETARDLVATIHRLEDLPDVQEAVAAGDMGFDRAVAVGRFAGRDDNLDLVGDLAGCDIAGIRSLAAKQRRMTRVDEECAFNDRYVIVEPNLDESAWRLNGRLPGVAGSVVVQALEAKADTLPAEPDTTSRAVRDADALWAISLAALSGGDGATIDTATPLLTVFVDASEATATNGETGVTVEAGPRVGRATVEAILCDGVIEVAARTPDGIPLAMGRRSRVIPPRLRRFVLHRDGAACTIAGCTSQYRLQVHHVNRWADGGRTDPGNLTTLCWFHHHVVIHGQGFTINPDTPPQRRRLLRPPIHGPPWLEQARARGMIVSEQRSSRQDPRQKTRDPRTRPIPTLPLHRPRYEQGYMRVRS